MNRNMKIGIIVAALASALVITLVFNRDEQVTADTPESKTHWMCASCKQPMELTQREVDEIVRQSPPPNPPINCRKCRADKAYRAKLCPKCRMVYPGEDVQEEGVTGLCPRCHPDKRRPIRLDPDEPQERDAQDQSVPNPGPRK